MFFCLFGWPASVSATEPIATTDGETPGIRITVQELKVVSGALMLKFTIENNNDREVSPAMSVSDTYSVDGIFLVDVPGKKKYLVVRDTDNRCLCSHDLPRLAANTSVAFWAKFPPPPDSVQKIGIVVPHFMPMDDVPISR
jgi:hypothetical protein